MKFVLDIYKIFSNEIGCQKSGFLHILHMLYFKFDEIQIENTDF